MASSSTPAQKNFVWSSEGYNSDFVVTFPKSPDMNLFLAGAELHQYPEQHDRLVLHFKGHMPLKTGSVVSQDPVVFTFRSGKVTSKWVGHVDHVEQPNNHKGGNTNIWCVGASWILKDTSQKIYKNVTADQVVAQICKAKGMQAITQRHPRVRDSIAQSGQSFWKFLSSLAKVTGFVLRAENSTILFMSKDKIYQTKKASAPYFKYVTSEVDGVTPESLRMTGTILSFNPDISDHSPEKGVRVDRVITGLNATTGTVLKTTHPTKKKPTTNRGVVVPNESYFKK